MTAGLDEQRAARAALTYLAEPGDPVLAALLRVCEPAEVVAAVAAGDTPVVRAIGGRAGELSRVGSARLAHAIEAWRRRLADVPTGADLAAFQRDGIRLVCPGEPEWPTQLDALGAARPYALWLRGNADLRYCCLRSVAVVGTRAATAYGAHVGAELAAALSERGWTIVSGAAYGIDGCAHRGALAADGVTVAVLACGVDYPYPRGHTELLAAIATQGVVVSEWPPGRRPHRSCFLTRNRVIAALSRGTVVVEAGLRSGALSTASHARDLGRPLMAVPGPVTSDLSAGCHKIIREWGGTCVTGPRDVIELLAPLGDAICAADGTDPTDTAAPGTSPRRGRDPAADQVGGTGAAARHTIPDDTVCAAAPVDGAVLPHDALDRVTAAVLRAVPARGGAGPATIAMSAGVSVDTVVRSLGLLAAGGFIERCAAGWRTRSRSDRRGLWPGRGRHGSVVWWRHSRGPPGRRPPPAGAAPVIAVGHDLTRYLRGCRIVARVTNDAGIANAEHGAPIAVCNGPRRPWSAEWPALRHLG